ncbi:MAG: DUF6158 family protein [Actinomycetota bacterium]|nr:DUF6158 family protein [Actinomycetota bacterium]
MAGVPPSELDDERLTREMDHLHETRNRTVRTGSEDALQAHSERMLELEAEFLRRFPDEGAPDPLRTRSGSRAAAGQDAETPDGRPDRSSL